MQAFAWRLVRSILLMVSAGRRPQLSRIPLGNSQVQASGGVCEGKDLVGAASAGVVFDTSGAEFAEYPGTGVCVAACA